jgi:non-ribosomal peptide synthetase-like protein
MTLAAEVSLLPAPLPPAVFRTGPAPAPRTLLDILDATTRRHPDAPALDDGTTTLTYRALSAAVEALRARLAAAGVTRGARVGVRIPSGTADLYVAILGVLAAGAAYVPVDADDPDERAELVFTEAAVGATLTADLTLTLLGDRSPGDTGRPTPDDDAWIIFTSGSTGRPKGVAVRHAAAAAFVDAEAGLFVPDAPIGPGDRVLAGLSVAFDASCEEMWLAWRHGGCLVPAPRSLVRTGVDLGPWLVAQGITVVSTVPTLAALWPPEALDAVRLLIFGGEACPPELAERAAVDGREVWNTYGPTEATVVACAAPLGGGPVRIGLPLTGWELAVVDADGEPVALGDTGELVIAGAGLARYLDPVKDTQKFAPLPALGWTRAYRSGDIVRADPAGLAFVGRADEQIKLGGRRIELGEIDAALQSLPHVTAAASAVRRTRAGTDILVGYVVPATDSAFDREAATARLRESLPASLVPLLAVVDDLPTRTSGKVDRAALPWPLPTGPAEVALDEGDAWLAECWEEVLGVPADGPMTDFFSNGGGSLTAAQLVARIRTRHPTIAVSDLYQHPTFGALASFLNGLDDSDEADAAETAGPVPTPRLAGVVQVLAMVPMLALVGLRWLAVLAAVAAALSWVGVSVPGVPVVAWWWLVVAWVVLFSPPGRIAVAAGGARLLLRGVRPGAYPRGGAVHLRLWAAERLAAYSGAENISGAAWMTLYARALGVRIGREIDLHSTPPVTGMLRVGDGAAVEPEVDLAGYWLDGDVLHLGAIDIGEGARVGSRSTLLPGTVIGAGARVDACATVLGAVPPGERWAGAPATRAGRSDNPGRPDDADQTGGAGADGAGRVGKDGGGDAWPRRRAGRSRFWVAAYGATSVLLGLVPVVAALPAVGLIGLAVAGTGSLAAALGWALVMVLPATVVYLLAYAVLVLVAVRVLGIGMRAGHHAVHSRAAWQVWATERLMGMARDGLFPLYASLATPAWLRALGARVGRGVEVSTVLALPKMTQVADGAFLADDTMVAAYELSHGWLHVGPARIGKRAFLGNSGMAAPGHAVPKRGLVGVLSSAPRKAKKGTSWLGMPPTRLRRVVTAAEDELTFAPPLRLRVARAVIEACRVVPVACSAALAVLVLAALAGLWTAGGLWLAALVAGPLLLVAGLAGCAVTTGAKWALVGRFRPVDRPLWSSFVWRNELADTFVEVLAVPWLIGAAGGTPLLTGWLRTMGARIGRGVWTETYWLPESDLVRLADGATVNRGCVVQTHLFHDRIMSMDEVTLDAGATLGPHGIVLPGASIGARTTVGPGSLVTRGDAVPAGTRWLGNPIAAWRT